MSESEPEFSEVCMAYEAACAAYEVARISMKVAEARRDGKKLNLKGLNRTLDDLLENEPEDSPVGKYPRLQEAIEEAEDLLEEAEDSFMEARNAFIDARQELETAYQAFMEEEAILACASLFAFDAEKCLHPHHQVQLFIVSLLRRGDSPKDWNLEHNDPVLKRLALRQLLSMAGIPQEF
jgi:hypothetical protein